MVNGAHDMGGMQNFGPIQVEDSGEVFHDEWEGHAFAIPLILAAKGVFNLDEFRYARERIPPAEFLNTSYYGLWLKSVETLVGEKGVRSWDPVEPEPDLPDRMRRMVLDGVPIARPGPTPRFHPGDRVRTKNFHPCGHTRMPRYARGKHGTIDLVHACFDLPDAHADGHDVPEPLYTVVFDSVELWGEAAHPGDTVRVDAWESYLEEDKT
jgi:nitrile hydratase subunit beta